MSAAFDTLAAARQLEDAGITRQHAEAIATVVRAGQGELATKGDIGELDTRLTGQISELDTRLTGQIKNLDDKVTTGFGTLRWIVGVNFAMTMAILATLLARAL